MLIALLWLPTLGPNKFFSFTIPKIFVFSKNSFPLGKNTDGNVKLWKKNGSDPNCRSYSSKLRQLKKEIKRCVWGKVCAAISAVFIGALESGILMYQVF